MGSRLLELNTGGRWPRKSLASPVRLTPLVKLPDSELRNYRFSKAGVQANTLVNAPRFDHGNRVWVAHPNGVDSTPRSAAISAIAIALRT